jgi:phage tail protein X
MFDPSIYETYVTEGDGIPLDLIAWRRYRTKTLGLVEATLTLNPGLADLTPLIPRGTTIKIPIDRPATPTQVAIVRLW